MITSGESQNGLPASIHALRHEIEKNRELDDAVHLAGGFARSIIRDVEKLRDERDLWRFRAEVRQEIS